MPQTQTRIRPRPIVVDEVQRDYLLTVADAIEQGRRLPEPIALCAPEALRAVAGAYDRADGRAQIVSDDYLDAVGF